MFSMFAYLGWSAAVYSAGETREAPRTVPRAMLLGTLIVLGLYAAVNAAMLVHIPLSELAQEKAVVELLVRKLFGEGVSRLFAGVVAFALLSSLGASAFLGPRVLHTMLGWYVSRVAPAPDSKAGESNDPGRSPEVPARLVWIQAGLSIGMILSGTFEQILTVTGFLLGIFPLLSVLGLYTQRANWPESVPGLARAVAIPLFVGGSLLILVLGALRSPREMGVASVVVLAIFVLRRKAIHSIGSTTPAP
jgi:APA family basic amino acid/polyamine antiporter